MIQSYVKETGTPIVSFQGDPAELREDLVRILYTMFTRSEESAQAAENALVKVNKMLLADLKLKQNAVYGSMACKKVEDSDEP